MATETLLIISNALTITALPPSRSSLRWSGNSQVWFCDGFLTTTIGQLVLLRSGGLGLLSEVTARQGQTQPRRVGAVPSEPVVPRPVLPKRGAVRGPLRGSLRVTNQLRRSFRAGRRGSVAQTVVGGLA